MKSNVFRISLVIGLIILFVGASIVPVISGTVLKNNNNNNGNMIIKRNGTLDKKIIYVDDDNCPGPGNGTLESPYCRIQYGIDNASDGDTVFVFNGEYFENIVVNKSIDLNGEDKKNTLIYNSNNNDVIKIFSYHTKLSNFTICNSIYGKYGIKINYTYDITISDNIIKNNHNGIGIFDANRINIFNNDFLENSNYCLYIWSELIGSSHSINISNNYFEVKGTSNGIYGEGSSDLIIYNNNFVNKTVNNEFENKAIFIITSLSVNISTNTIRNIGIGIFLDGCYLEEIEIYKNTIRNCYQQGILLFYSHAYIYHNTIKNCGNMDIPLIYEFGGIIAYGLSKKLSDIIIEHNTIEECKLYGLYLERVSVDVVNNDFIWNTRSAFFMDADTSWNGNFWNRWRLILLVPIFGLVRLPLGIWMYQVKFDFRPAPAPNNP